MVTLATKENRFVWTDLAALLHSSAGKRDVSGEARDAKGRWVEGSGEHALKQMEGFRQRLDALSEEHQAESKGIMDAWKAWQADTQNRKKPLKVDGAAAKKLPSYKHAQALEATFTENNERRRQQYKDIGQEALASLKVPVDQRSTTPLVNKAKTPLFTSTVAMAKKAMEHFREFDGSGAFVPMKFPADKGAQIKELFGTDAVENADGTFSIPFSLHMANLADEGGGKRAHATMTGIAISRVEDRPTTIYHEVAHHLEMRSNAILKAAVEFRASMAEPKEGKEKFVLPGGQNEIALHSRLKDPYTSKLYPDDIATEVISTGVARYMDDPLTFSQDSPEHFKFIYDVLHGKYR